MSETNTGTNVDVIHLTVSQPILEVIGTAHNSEMRASIEAIQFSKEYKESDAYLRSAFEANQLLLLARKIKSEI